MNPNWQLETKHANAKKFQKFNGKHAREYASLFANLEKVLRLLRSGNKLGSFQIGFFRSENEGIFRIGQTGVLGAKESRLYVYPDIEQRIMFILNIGDKDTQDNDINESKTMVRIIKAKVISSPSEAA